MSRNIDSNAGVEGGSDFDWVRSRRRRNWILMAILLGCVVGVFTLGIVHVGREAGFDRLEQKRP